jgi:hypothetical protein
MINQDLETTDTKKFSTSSPINSNNKSSSDNHMKPDLESNGEESDGANDGDGGEDESEMEDNVTCDCSEHKGQEMLNRNYDLSVNALWECIFGHTEFCKKYWDSRKFFDFNKTDWKLRSDSMPARHLEYKVDLGRAIGKPTNSEDQVIFLSNFILFIQFIKTKNWLKYKTTRRRLLKI